MPRRNVSTTPLQALNLLESYDLKALKHNSPDYVHTLTEAIKLAFADRDRYYGDPFFVKVPGAELLSKEYAALRRAPLRLPKPEEYERGSGPLRLSHRRYQIDLPRAEPHNISVRRGFHDAAGYEPLTSKRYNLAFGARLARAMPPGWHRATPRPTPRRSRSSRPAARRAPTDSRRRPPRPIGRPRLHAPARAVPSRSRGRRSS